MVVTGRLSFGKEEALSLAKAFTGLTAQSKAQRLGLSQPRGNLGAREARYQAERVIREWVKKAGARPKKAWEIGKRSTGNGRFLQRSLRHEPRRKRMKLVERYLVYGSIAETPQGVCLFQPPFLSPGLDTEATTGPYSLAGKSEKTGRPIRRPPSQTRHRQGQIAGQGAFKAADRSCAGSVT